MARRGDLAVQLGKRRGSGGDARRERGVAARLAPQTLPFSIDWLPDGRLLVVDGPQRLLLRQQQPGGPLETAADLSGLGPASLNELVVDSAGNAYVNGPHGHRDEAGMSHVHFTCHNVTYRH